MAEKDFVVKNGLVVNTNLIVADGDLNRVGINNTTPDATLSVTGTANVSGNVILRSTLGVSGNVTLDSQLTATGNVSLGNGTITVTTGTSNLVTITNQSNVIIDQGLLFIDAINNRIGVNNTTPDSTLSVNGTASISGNLSVLGNFVITGNVVSNGTQEFTGALTPSSNGTLLGNTTNRWNIFAANGDFSNNLLVSNRIVVGNSTVNVTINSTAFSGISNNSTNFAGQPQSYYTNASNFDSGTIPSGRLNGAYTNVTQIGTLSGLAVTGNVNIDSGLLFVDGTNNRVGVNTAIPTVSLQISSNDAILVPIGNTTNRPTGANGMIRYNAEINLFEGYANGAWGSIAGISGGYYKGNRGTVGDVTSKQNLFRINANTQSNNITISAGENALAVGPITVQPGFTLVVEEGGRAVII